MDLSHKTFHDQLILKSFIRFCLHQFSSNLPICDQWLIGDVLTHNCEGGNIPQIVQIFLWSFVYLNVGEHFNFNLKFTLITYDLKGSKWTLHFM